MGRGNSGHSRRSYSELYYAGEGPPTLQSTIIPVWTYALQMLGKVTPTFSPIVNASRKEKYTKNVFPNVQKNHEIASHPNGFKLCKIINKINQNNTFQYQNTM